MTSNYFLGFPSSSVGKESALKWRRPGFNPWVRKILWRRKWQLTAVLLLENSRDRGAWQAIVHGITKSANNFHFRPTKCPDIPVSLKRNTEVFRQHFLWAPSTLLSRSGVPDLPVAPQDEAGLTTTFQTWPRGWFHIPKDPDFPVPSW